MCNHKAMCFRLYNIINCYFDLILRFCLTSYKHSLVVVHYDMAPFSLVNWSPYLILHLVQKSGPNIDTPGNLSMEHTKAL